MVPSRNFQDNKGLGFRDKQTLALRSLLLFSKGGDIHGDKGALQIH
jgi:hypothetical protein